MARKPKEQQLLHCRLDAALATKLEDYAKKTKRTKTAVVEMALSNLFWTQDRSGMDDAKSE